jgi:hypothetical protein
MRGSIEKIEEFPLGSVKLSQRRSVLALYHLFIRLAGPRYERVRHEELLKRYGADFDEPNIEWLAICLVTEAEFPWRLDQLEALHESYYRGRRRKTAIMLGELLEAMFTLRLAEINRVTGNEARARELITFAVEAFPGNQAIRTLEANLALDKLGPIVAVTVLLPRTVDQTTKAL